MSKRHLIITEKPSVAKAVANYLGVIKFDKANEHYLCKNDYKVTYLFGHILEAAKWEDYDSDLKRWDWATIPFFPKDDEFKLLEKPNHKKHIKLLRALLKDTDVVIHSGDNDREGQLLVDEVLEYLKNKKPVKRILLNALDDRSIKQAFSELRDNRDFYNLSMAGRARSYADLLVGLNLTRAFTLWNQQNNRKQLKEEGEVGLISVGRVQTPTLKLIADRFVARRDFKPRVFYGISAECDKAGQRFKLLFKNKDKSIEDEEGYITDKSDIENVLNNIDGKPFLVDSFTQKQQKQEPPLGFSLSKLQEEANKIWGFSATDTLQYAQSLYTKAYLSYPRTDCEYLPENLYEESKAILTNLVGTLGVGRDYDFKLHSKIWNDKKVGAHFAIIPTLNKLNLDSLENENERKIYRLVGLRYLMQFHPNALYDVRSVSGKIDKYDFASTGKVLTDEGWRVLLQAISSKVGKDDEEQEDEELGNIIPILLEKESVPVIKASLTDGKTKAPPLFTEGSLIKMMANAHLLVRYDESLNNEEKKRFAENLKTTKGIGTEATRAGIIKTLLDRKFIKIKGKNLIPTEQGLFIAGLFRDNATIRDNFVFISKVSATAFFEEYLDEIAAGRYTISEFLQKIKEYVGKVSVLKSLKS